MSRFLAATLILSATFAIDAAAATIDLDKPGAMEDLERERPGHYRQVMEEISRAQEIRIDREPSLRRAESAMDDPRTRESGTLLTTDPAKKRLTIFLDEAVYRVTAHMTRHPARREKAE